MWDNSWNKNESVDRKKFDWWILKVQQRVHKFSWIYLQNCSSTKAEIVTNMNINIQACLQHCFPTCRELTVPDTTSISWIIGFKTVVAIGFSSSLRGSKSFRCLFTMLISNNKVRERINTLQVTCGHSDNVSLDRSPSKYEKPRFPGVYVFPFRWKIMKLPRSENLVLCSNLVWKEHS